VNWSIWLILSALSGAPCFPDRPSLDAWSMFDDLTPYATDVELVAADGPPSGMFGRCTVEGGFVRDPDGRTVAERSCGLTVFVPDIVDDLGIEVGSPGSAVRGGLGARAARITCMADPDGGVRCYVSDDDEIVRLYLLDGSIAEELDGEAAWSYVAAHTITRYQVRGSCH
jgi:hypothetical protein